MICYRSNSNFTTNSQKKIRSIVVAVVVIAVVVVAVAIVVVVVVVVAFAFSKLRYKEALLVVTVVIYNSLSYSVAPSQQPLA
jgi:ABC-type glycerol-3-phosphate transport system permease component